MKITRRAFAAGVSSAALFASAKNAGAGVGDDDLRIVRRAYETLHPGLFRYATPAGWDAGLALLGREWSSDTTLRGRYLALSRFLATIKCGHTYANFYNQKSAVAETLFAQRNRLPFHFRWIDGKMIVTNHGNDALPRGTEVVAVDGRKAGAILQSLVPYARADGSNDAKRVAQLEVQGTDRYESFDVFFGLTHVKRGSAFAIEAITPSGSRTVQVEPIDLQARRARMKPSLRDKNAPQWTLQIDGLTGVLAMPNWALYDSQWDWHGFLDRAFEEIASRSVRGLIIDLRGNEGGLDCGDDIVARLIDEDLYPLAYERRVRFRRTPEDIDAYLDTWDPSFKRLGEGAEPLDAGFFRLKEEDGKPATPIRPKGPRFRGRVIVLIDAANSSATFQFAQLIQSRRLGTLVGAPTGGNRRGINGGAFFFLRLPQSGLEADVPLIGTFPRQPEPDAGLTPDVAVRISAADIAAGRDAVLARAHGLIRS